jgi:hypothetical protein
VSYGRAARGGRWRNRSKGQWLGETGLSEAISKAAEVAPTPEHQAIIGTFEDSKDGAELPGLAALGEYVAPVVEKPVKPKKTAAEKPDEDPIVER